jgi:hypothetical protein
LPITDTELNVMAALAIVGLSQQAHERVEHPGGDRHTKDIVNTREEQV